MIFYFTGTGNSKWAAELLAASTDDVAYDIASPASPVRTSKESQIGFVFPIHAWGVPEPMLEFAKAAKVPEDAFVFGVCTCGADAGLAMEKLSEIVALDAAYSVVMPNNYLIGSDLESPEEALRKIDAAKSELVRISREIASKTKAWRVEKGSAAALKSNFVNFGFNKFARSVKPFETTEACDGCGICEMRCPAGAISLPHGRPEWREGCYQCLRCINECPHEAIQYGDKTEGRQRYTLRSCLQQAETKG